MRKGKGDMRRDEEVRGRDGGGEGGEPLIKGI